MRTMRAGIILTTLSGTLLALVADVRAQSLLPKATVQRASTVTMV